MMKLDEIISTMRERIINDVPVSPDSWIVSAQMLNVLQEDLDNQIAGMEACMIEREVQHIQDGEAAAKAKVLSRTAIDYRIYLELKAKQKRIQEYINLAKKRFSSQRKAYSA